MNAPMNRGRYNRCFPLPSDRPSNAPTAWLIDAETRRRVQELNAWLDEQAETAVVRGAESLLDAEAQRRGWVRPGDPGE
ncbi:hypothetical protein [Actinoplanes sp. NPDC051494]|uniref:hypothetical protein n=1 Tax=Actinoplanes sp. NPDC051494 TaxID=3363907 RepID=UPI0037B0FD9D